MGDYAHKTLIVQGSDWSERDMSVAQAIAVEAFSKSPFPDHVRNLVSTFHTANGFIFFYVAPSGGKMGGGIERDWLMAFEQFKARTGDLNIDWLVVEHGEFGNKIVQQKKWSRADGDHRR